MVPFLRIQRQRVANPVTGWMLMATAELTTEGAKPGAPRLKDVAALAGVSSATVSRALSGNGLVSARTRTKVEKAADELGFVMSYHASSLASGRSRNIGIVLPFVGRWYFSTVLEGAAAALMEAGYDLTLYNFEGDRYRESILSDFLLRKRLDAVVAVALNLDKQETEQLLSTGIPVVGVGGPLAGVSTISIDEFDAGRRATEHLIGLGHRKVAHVGGENEQDRYFRTSGDRRSGYLQAMKSADLLVNPAWLLTSDYSFNDAYQQAKNLLADPVNRPTAIFSASDEMAAGVILAARDLGLSVPGNLSVIGIDAHPIGQSFGLTTLDQHAHDQGVHAVESILDQLAGTSAEPTNNVLPTNFLVRSSTAPPPDQ